MIRHVEHRRTEFQADRFMNRDILLYCRIPVIEQGPLMAS
jgi:hypothetical protein